MPTCIVSILILIFECHENKILNNMCDCLDLDSQNFAVAVDKDMVVEVCIVVEEHIVVEERIGAVVYIVVEEYIVVEGQVEKEHD